MHFQSSDLFDPSTYETEGLCDNIPLRSKLVGPLGFYKGGLGPEYNFIQVTVPECLPERLEIIAYANEFAFLYDGKNHSSS